MRQIILMILILLPGMSLAQEGYSLGDAIARGLVEIAGLRGTGGYQGQCLEIVIHNKSGNPITINIQPGTMFGSKDEWIQDLIITSPEQIIVAAGRQEKRTLWTMCTQAWNASPSLGSLFSYKGLADFHVRKLAYRISAGNYQTSTAQSAMWAVTSREPVRNIYGIDTTETRDLAETVSEITGIPISQFELAPRPHQIITMNASLECLLTSQVNNGRLVLVNQHGDQIREYFSGRKIEDGFQQFRVGTSHTGDSADSFFLRLLDGEEMVAEKEISVADTIMVLPRLRQQAILEYDLEETTEVVIGLYDEEGQLHMRITQPRMLQQGFHRSRTIADTPVMPDREYFIRAVSGDRIITSQPVRIADEEPVIHPKQVLQGTWTMTIPEELGPGRVALYNGDGSLKRIFSTFTPLNPGNRRFTYEFDHVQGPEAVFFLRIETEDGTVIDELKLEAR